MYVLLIKHLLMVLVKILNEELYSFLIRISIRGKNHMFFDVFSQKLSYIRNFKIAFHDFVVLQNFDCCSHVFCEIECLIHVKLLLVFKNFIEELV